MGEPNSAPSRKGWMEGSATSLRGALLSLVLERRGHGYDLANRLAERLGGSWSVDAKDVYRLLEVLEEEGLLRVSVEQRPGRRQPLTVYHPTDSTAAALAEWMATLLPKEPMRVGIRAKVAAAREQDARSLLLALRAYERECLKLLQLTTVTAKVLSWKGLVTDSTREAVDTQLRGEIELARRTRHRIDEYLARRGGGG
jgi:DNA-binding PadR family transcriptional regulator